jgi:hypothetical protein
MLYAEKCEGNHVTPHGKPLPLRVWIASEERSKTMFNDVTASADCQSQLREL